MSRIYGIDLGTTNSLIGYKDKLYGGLVPSIADLDRKLAGESERTNYNAERSFKVNISSGNEGKAPIAASSLVLLELKKQVLKDFNDQIEVDPISVKLDVVISVPAYFSDNQRQATIKAANMVGLNVRALVNEPTAAAMFYSRNIKNLTVVYDLGGGTFDVSVIDSRFGNYDVQATDGLILGGDNFDEALLRYVWKQSGFKPYKVKVGQLKAVKDEMKYLCEQAKITIQKTLAGCIVDLSKFKDYCVVTKIEITKETYINIMKVIFGPTIAKTKQLVAESIMYGDVYDFLLVGGSTRCPFLQSWIESELGKRPVPITYDPDRIVAQGACLYASLVESGDIELMVSDVTKALSLGMSDGTVKVIIPNNSKVPISDFTTVTNPVESDGINLRVYQGDSVLACNNECIGILVYEFGETLPALKAHVKVTIEVTLDGIVKLRAKQTLKPEVSINLKRE